jgi:hypothetical protein
MVLYLSMEFDCGIERRCDAQAHCPTGADPAPNRAVPVTRRRT